MDSPATKRYRVFIVDNNEDLAWSLSEVLSLEPDLESVGWCSAGAEALAKARAAGADLMILDFRLADCNALAILDQARLTDPTLGILIYSGYLADDLTAEVLARGAAGYVPKGGSVETLTQEIRRIVGARRAA